MFWENLLDLVSTVDTPAQANFTTPVRSARSVIMKKVNFVLAVLPEKKDNFICAFCNWPLILGNTACLISLLHIPEHLKLDNWLLEGSWKSIWKWSWPLLEWKAESSNRGHQKVHVAASRAVCLQVSEIQLNNQKNIEIDNCFYKCWMADSFTSSRWYVWVPWHLLYVWVVYNMQQPWRKAL